MATEYVNPRYINDSNRTDAEAFDEYLADHCIWDAGDFGGDYAWNCSIPPRESWAAEVERLNGNLEAAE